MLQLSKVDHGVLRQSRPTHLFDVMDYVTHLGLWFYNIWLGFCALTFLHKKRITLAAASFQPQPQMKIMQRRPKLNSQLVNKSRQTTP